MALNQGSNLYTYTHFDSCQLVSGSYGLMLRRR